MHLKIIRVIILTIVSFLFISCKPCMLKPSQMVSLGGHADPGQTGEVASGNPDGTGGGTYTVPAEKVLIITNVIIHPMTLQAGTLMISLIQSDAQLGDRIRQTWHVPNSEPTQFDFSPGYIISSGSILKIRNDSSSSGEIHVSLYGYIGSDD